MRVLICEDDLVSRKVLSRFLAPFGETVLAADGNEATKHFEEAVQANKPFDLILLDMVMPFKDGLETLKSVRDHERQAGTKEPVKIIMLTGQGDSLQINQAKTIGISDYMLKPIEEVKLVRELQRLGLVPDEQDQWG